ncbi:MAG TPA: family 20 glycosylhydrolase [Bryobacteraceae bacterium]|nr:family 20 glycosylhydrolase [Bryobacteraceae bacterium]
MKPLRLLSLTLLVAALLPAQDGFPPLMPWPAQITRGRGSLGVNDGLRVVAAITTPRIGRAIGRFERRFEARTGIPRGQQGAAAVEVRFARETGEFPRLGDDESYRVEVRPDGARLEAATDLGVLRGLETVLQLVQMSGQGWALPAVTIDDRPRFPWRGLLLDVSRHWLGMDAVKRTLDGMALVKMNVLHWHLTDDQGFRVESRRYPKLHGMGSDGLYFRQAEIRDIIAYAADRGIRVVPEFDMPGHTNSWFVGHPELASMPGPYELIRNWGIFEPVMDPARESTYELLGGFIEEMAGLFPDQYFHIGGDEVEGKHWDRNPAIVEFRKNNGLATNHDLQARFNQRLLPLVTRAGKTMTGWDDILHPQLPKDIVVQSWRNQKTLAAAVRQGYRSMLSTGFYLDLMLPASTHYAVEPFEGPGAGLTDEEKGRVLGGEACMWAEFATPEMLDARVWPRAAAIAERLWSPQSVRDLDSMYRRLEAVSRELDRAGLTHRIAYERMLERLAGEGPIGPVRTLAEVVEPVKNYKRNATRKYFQSTPLNRMVDTARPESERARQFGRVVKRFLESRQQADADRIRRALERWRDNDRELAPVIERSALLAELKPVSAALKEVAAVGLQALNGRAEGAAERLKAAENPGAELLISILPHVRALAAAAR